MGREESTGVRESVTLGVWEMRATELMFQLFYRQHFVGHGYFDSDEWFINRTIHTLSESELGNLIDQTGRAVVLLQNADEMAEDEDALPKTKTIRPGDI